MARQDDTPSMALFCDFENVALGVRDARYDKFDIRKVLERLLLKGSIVVKKAYCDWNRYREFKAEMHEASFELIEIPHVRQSGKNSADIRMVVDALDLCYTKSHVDTFVIISGDSDFSPLVSKLRENAKTVIGVGVKGSTSDLLTANCDEFIFYDDLVREQRRRGTARAGSARDGARTGRGQPRAAEPVPESPVRAPLAPEPRAGTAGEASAAPRPAPEDAAGERPSEHAGVETAPVKKRAPRRRKAGVSAAGADAAAAASADAAETSLPGEGAGAATLFDAAPDTAGDDLSGDAFLHALLPESALDDTPADAPREKRSEEERRQEALDLVVETVEALITERGADDKIWGSMVKQTLKRRRPGFAESYYGYRSFNELLEEARSRGLLALDHDEKSGGYVIRLL